MLPHAEIVVRAPDGDRLRAIMARKAARIGELALVAQDIDKDAVATFGMQPVDSLVENFVIVHGKQSPVGCPPNNAGQTGNPARTIRNISIRVT